jgi:hypothetical protein
MYNLTSHPLSQQQQHRAGMGWLDGFVLGGLQLFLFVTNG